MTGAYRALHQSLLEGVLVPMRAKDNVDMLLAAGFESVDTFWRWMNFTGWVAVRGAGHPKKDVV